MKINLSIKDEKVYQILKSQPSISAYVEHLVRMEDIHKRFDRLEELLHNRPQVVLSEPNDTSRFLDF